MGLSFSDYIREYEMSRGEGVLLRAINDVYKVLVKTVPDSFKNDEILEFETEIALILRSVDASLTDEWERLRSDFVELGGAVRIASGDAERSSRMIEEQAKMAIDLKSRQAELRRRVRAEVFRFTRALASGDSEEAFNIASEWKALQLRRLSLSFHDLWADVPEASWCTVERLAPVYFSDALLSLKSEGFTGLKTDLTSRNANLTTLSFSEIVSIEHRLLDLGGSDESYWLRFELDFAERST